MNMPIEQLVLILYREMLARFRLIILCFVVISVVVLINGYNWPKKFSSSTSLFADQTNIIGPLMEGVADTTQVMSQANAREVIFSRRTMKEILQVGGWMDDSPSAVEQERIANDIKARTVIGVASGLIRITYTDNDAERAFRTASKYAEMFLDETIRSKKQESREAYGFIDKQVNEYHQKLTEAEERLKTFRSDNIDATPGRQNEVYANISQLRRRIDSTELSLKEAHIRRKSLEAQLSGEVATVGSNNTVSFYQERLEHLKRQYDSLRLSYHDSYPDIVRTKQQIEDIKMTIDAENGKAALGRNNTQESVGSYEDEPLSYTPFYQQLKINLSATRTEIEMFKIRLIETRKRLDNERKRALMMSEGQALESELARDYEVNQTIYRDLLRKRENARVSMHLDMEGRGLTYKVQESANLPLVPSGVRFMHFILLGPIAGIGIPLGILFVLIQIDPRVRMEATLIDKMELPVLAVTGEFDSVSGGFARQYSILGLALGFVAVIYVVLIWAKLTSFQFSNLLGVG
ncbi:MAG: hypothetical protein KUG82_04730 [Pseudomonadales bacterium]|nr:hypothetical protein [Pseudomonadales bacterium]